MEKLRKPLIFITIIYALIYYLFILFWSTNTLGMGIVAVTGPIIALIFLGVAIYHIKELEEKRFWFIIFAACFSYFIGEFMWVAMDYPFPSWANFFFNLFVILYSLAILYKVYMKRRQYGSIQLFFDSFIIMTVLTTITWVYFLEPLLQYETSTFHFILSLTYPAAHLGILIGIVMLFVSYKSTFPPIVLTINTAVVFIYTIAEFYYLYRAIYDNYNYLSLITPVWNICVILIGLSSFYGSHIDVQSPQEEKNQAKKVHSIFIIIPYLSLMVLVILAIIKKEAILGIFIGGMVVLFFIVIRQVITISENGTLVRQLKGRTEELERLQIEQLELKEAADEQSWLKTRIAEIANMYPGISDLETLAHLFIRKVTPMVGASYGVFYVKQDEGNQERFQKLAAYADHYENQKEVGASSFQLGEGLVGQCALENRIISLHQVPEDYIKINSGLGKASPSDVLIIPAEYKGEVLAVIELASFTSFSDQELMLLKEGMSNLGINIQSILRQMKIEKLLQESQALTEELQSQSEELQSQQEELRTVNEQLEEQYEHSEQKTREVEKVKDALEEKAQQLTLSSQYKSEFLANMSHELRTPLNSLLILAQTLTDNIDGNLTDKQVSYAKTIYSSGNDLLHLINDILDIVKIEAGKTEVISKDVELTNVKEFVEAQFTPVARKKNIKLHVQLASDLPEMIHTDKQRLQQILKNLLSNAFKFTEHGAVTLTMEKAKKGRFGEEQEDAFTQSNIEFVFSVKDTGIGIAAENQGIIFDAFKQADGTISRKYGGTGLGLSISRELAHLLGGFIEVESIGGDGSTFTLYLPHYQNIASEEDQNIARKEIAISEAATATALLENPSTAPVASAEYPFQTEDSWKQAQGRKALLEGKKILVVDDDMRNVFALTTALESYQVEVVFAENGKDGITVLQGNPDIDLVIMDIMMPEMDGFETIRVIRQLPEFQSVPIIALTAKAMKNDRQECIEAGASDYISKPVNLDQLFSIIRVWLYR
ncbi:response regulator [Domibacillus aminovorans]|uniref:Circadian input-output histidine kinase CikA n=1 Tax=Domibacillus aminovorans TaxID=29332 RepID=A0A177L516_9BACI|nr:response regulator [Domibacillus aminovorans]OAH60769.1 hypothetical protein AWH49_15055 [Domibacillus aminovorans]